MFFKNLKKYHTFCVVMLAVLLMMPVHVFAAGPYTPIEGVTVKVNGSTNDSMTDGAVTVTAKGSAGIFGFGASAKTTNITITNSGTEEATIAFDWTATTVNQLTIDGTATTDTAGNFNKTLAANESVTIKIVTAKNSTENKLEMKNFKWSAASAKYSLTLQYDGGSVTVDGTQKTSGSVVEVEGTGAELEATGNFVAWVDAATNQVLSTDNPYRWIPEGDITVKAVMTTNACFLATADGKLYDDLNQAANVGAGTVILLNNGTLPADNYTIPSGVTLLIPYNDANTVITNNMGDYDILPAEAGAQSLYRQLTMPAGANITVENGGSINVGSRASRQMTGQVGAYGAIKMDNGSSITVGNGGTLYAWGYIFPGTDGSGTVTIQSGGTVHEALMTMDYPGSASSTLDLFNENGIFPLRTFTVRNVEVPMTLMHGAKEYGFYHFYGTTAGEYPGTIAFVGSDSSFVFQTTTNGSMTKSYVSGKQKIAVSGDGFLNSINITFKKLGETKVSSSKTSGFPVPSGYDLEVASGTFTLNENVILLEGSKITIAEGATVNTNGKNVYVFDADDDAGSVSATDVHGTKYAPVNQDAVIDVNGTVNVSGGFYTSAGNASIISSGETGRVNLTTVSTATTVSIKTAKAKASTYDVNPAYLQNVNEVYVDTSSAKAGDYYQNIDGYWHHNTEVHTYNENGICTQCDLSAVAAIISDNGTGYFSSLSAACEAFTTDDLYIQMLTGTTEPGFTIDQKIYLDLNGQDVEISEGKLTISDGYTLYGMDTATNGFTSDTADKYGEIIGTVSGTVAQNYQYDRTTGVSGKYYVTSATKNLSFHRFDMGVTDYTFYGSGTTGEMVFNMVFKGDALAKAEILKRGVCFDESYNWNGVEDTMTGRITNITGDNFTTAYTVKAAVMLRDADNTVFTGDKYFANGISFQSAMKAVYSEQNKAAFDKFAAANGFSLSN